jgi:hypothetical protein
MTIKIGGWGKVKLEALNAVPSNSASKKNNFCLKLGCTQLLVESSQELFDFVGPTS